MNLNFDVLKNDERAIFGLRTLYQKYGYSQYKMSRFEEYDLYVQNKDFLVSDNVITFTDANGRLMALKPDVTLSIIKNTKDIPGCVQKLYYNENVYRISKGSRNFKEIMQTGLECIGDIGTYDICEVIMLACESLATISDNWVLDISHMGLLNSLIDDFFKDTASKALALKYINDKNAHGLFKLMSTFETDEKKADAFINLVTSYDSLSAMVKKLEVSYLNENNLSFINEIKKVSEIMSAWNFNENIKLDFSIVNDINYYNGIVFQGFIKEIPEGILSGGQYDKLMSKMEKKSGAIGFAVYLDMLERLNTEEKTYDTDILLVYDEKTDPLTLIKTINRLTDDGKSVMAQKAVPEMIKYRQQIRLGKGGIETIE